jgi:alpha-L-fucosidase 2
VLPAECPCAIARALLPAGAVRALTPWSFLLLLVMLPAVAAAQPCPALQVRNPAGNYIIPGAAGDIPYSGSLSLDAYVQDAAGLRPSIIVIHGGRWSSGSRVAHIGQILEAVTRAGFNWFSVDYRVGGLERFEDSLTDLRAALAFIRCRAAEFGIDPSRLVLLGEDSGAHLAALLAGENPPGVTGVVLIGGFYDLGAIPALSRSIDQALLARASPAGRVTSQMPPMLVVHGSADSEAPPADARQYCGQVVTAGGACQFLEVAGASHRSENWLPAHWSYKGVMTRWLSAAARVSALSHRPRPGVVLKDILYNRSAQLRLDAFLPKAETPVPAVIVVHGGGWEAGDKVTYVTPLFEPLARAGLAWFSIDYRLTPAVTHEQQLDDVRRAVRFVRAQHKRFNIDARRVVLLGESASGQMVTLLGAEDSSLAGIVSFYGVYDFEGMVTDASPRSLLVRLFRRGVLNDDARAVLRRYSPLHRAHKDLPPLLMINGTGEQLWAQAQAFAARLTELGAQHEVIALEGAPHGLENWEGRPEWIGYKGRLVEWIQQATSAAKPPGIAPRRLH